MKDTKELEKTLARYAAGILAARDALKTYSANRESTEAEVEAHGALLWAVDPECEVYNLFGTHWALAERLAARLAKTDPTKDANRIERPRLGMFQGESHIVHAISANPEFTVCGIAFNIARDELHLGECEPHLGEFSEVFQGVVNCANCAQIIESFSGISIAPKKQRIG